MAEAIGGDGHRKVREWVTEGIDRAINANNRRLLLTSHRNLVRPPQDGGTPRDTGRAAMGWTPSVGAPSTYEPPEDGGTPRANPGRLVPRPESMDVGEDLYETNLVPYIGVLNGTTPPPYPKRPWSDQARPGFIEAAVRDAIRETGGSLS